MSESLEVEMRLAFFEDPEATERSTPCEGCDDYCTLKEADELLAEVYGDDQLCNGRSFIRQEALWVCVIKWCPKAPHPMHEIRTVAREYGDARTDAFRRLEGLQANWAAARLGDSDDR